MHSPNTHAWGISLTPGSVFATPQWRTIAQPYGNTPTAPPVAPSADPGSSAYLTQAAQAYATYEASRDPRVLLGVYKARIKNYKEMKKKIPVMAVFYDAQINVLKAKVAALEQQLAIKVEGEQATRDWRSLGQTGVAMGIVGGVAVVALLAALTARVVRS